MNEAAISMSLGLVSLAGARAYGCWSKRRKRLDLEKARVSALVLSRGTGKSQMCEHLQGNSGLRVIDVSDAIDRLSKNKSNVDVALPISEVEHLMFAKEYVANVKKSMPNYKLVLLCNSIEEALYLDVPKENLVVCTPSQELLKTIQRGNEAGESKIVERERLDLISKCDGDKINVFTSYVELYNTIKSTYQLRSKWN